MKNRPNSPKVILHRVECHKIIIDLSQAIFVCRFKLGKNDVISRYTSGRFDDNKKHKVSLEIRETTITLKVDGGNEVSAAGFDDNVYVGTRTTYLGGISRDAGYHKM